jgi:hypothetical protein
LGVGAAVPVRLPVALGMTTPLVTVWFNELEVVEEEDAVDGRDVPLTEGVVTVPSTEVVVRVESLMVLEDVLESVLVV